MPLSADQILAIEDRPVERIQVPEWGGEVCVRAMSGADRDAFEAAMLVNGRQSMVNVRARAAALCICDDGGKPLFSAQDVEALGTKSGAALDRVFQAVLRMNHLSPQDVETLAGN